MICVRLRIRFCVYVSPFPTRSLFETAARAVINTYTRNGTTYLYNASYLGVTRARRWRVLSESQVKSLTTMLSDPLFASLIR